MEFLSLSRRRSSARNVPSGEERGETDVFAGCSCCGCASFPGRYHDLQPTLAVLFRISLLSPLQWPSSKIDGNFTSLREASEGGFEFVLVGTVIASHADFLGESCM